MKKPNSSRQNPKPAVKSKRAQQPVTIGMDLDDRTSRYCVLSDDGEILQEGQMATTKAGITQTFGSMGRARIAIEVGTHSPWVSRLMRSFGHEVIVANPRQVKLITESSWKDDRLDAQTFFKLRTPSWHRSNAPPRVRMEVGSRDFPQLGWGHLNQKPGSSSRRFRA